MINKDACPIFREETHDQPYPPVKSLQSLLWVQMRKMAFVAALAVLIANPIIGRAQTTSAQVNGAVTDSTGAIVIGASVTITNTATGLVYRAITDSLGAYHVTDLPPGSYTMDVTRAGFATQRIQPFTLIVGQLFSQNIALAVGQAIQTVSVNAAALLLNTETSHDEQLIEGQQIDDMPLNGRDYLQLAQLDAGVVPVSGISGISSPASSWASDSGVVAIAVSGLREDDNSYLYDGIETRNAWYGAAGLQPDPDMVQEFVMLNSTAPAQYGVGGAFINIVTRSGSNRFHGTAYEYLRNNDFDARNYFDVTPSTPPFHQNQFGASVGGPIKRNKIFFFGNYEEVSVSLCRATITIWFRMPTRKRVTSSSDTQQPLRQPLRSRCGVANRLCASAGQPGAKFLLQRRRAENSGAVPAIQWLLPQWHRELLQRRNNHQ